jgi:CheY-like chemotaxis protein
MPRVLVIDDDATQADLRRLILEHAGHSVATATTSAAAREAFNEHDPDIVVMDLHLPRTEDGLRLIRSFRRRKPDIRIVILSGDAGALNGHPELAMVDQVLRKPARSATLLKMIAKLACVLLLIAPAFAAELGIHADKAAEYVATLSMSGPGTDWARPEHESAMARVRMDGQREFHVMLYAGEMVHDYRVFLGRLSVGEHRLTVENEPRWSSPGTSIHVAHLAAEAANDDGVIQRAPVLFARENTVGKFTDVPMIVYAERQGDVLTYTVIFSNEDGGTSTRGLMARWGRTTDIEYVYRLDLRTGQAIIQAKDHKDIPFNGKYDGLHPLLIPSTNNNMVSGEGQSAIRYQIAPVLVDLSKHSREHVMDERPLAYRVMAQELAREDKLRPFGTVDHNKVSDPRNYLYLEAKVGNRDSALATWVRLEGETRWHSSHTGRVDLAIERDGWIRTTVELPPGTTPAKVAEVGFSCVIPQDDEKHFYLAGECRVEAVSKVFFLSQDYVPGASFWAMKDAVSIPSGQMIAFRIR